MQTFTLQIEKAYKQAIETERDASFHLPETCEEILMTKLPHLVKEWAKLVCREEDRTEGKAGGGGEPKFD